MEVPGPSNSICGASQPDAVNDRGATQPTASAMDVGREPIAELTGAAASVFSGIEELGRLPKQSKRASSAAERVENQLAIRYSKLKSTLSAYVQRALGQLIPAPAASGAGSASQPAAGDGLGTDLKVPRVYSLSDIENRILELDALPCDMTGSIWLIEFCCSSCSRLSALAPGFGRSAIRICKKDAPDSGGGRRRVMHVLNWLKARGARVDAFGSVPCTGWSTWQRINLKRYGEDFRLKLARDRNRSCVLLQRFGEVGSLCVSTGGHTSMEWPRVNDGWPDRDVARLIAPFNVHSAVFDGCAFGLVSRRGRPIIA